MDEETRKKISEALKGKKKTITAPNPTWFKKGQSPTAPFPKGGTPWNKGKVYGKCRNCSTGQYKVWRNAVLKRDGNKCTKCEATTKLHAHHIIPWKEDEGKRFDVDNGLTLCHGCHTRLEYSLNPKRLKAKHCVPHTEEAKKKMSEALKGKPSWNKGKELTEAHKLKLCEAKIGHIPWNKGVYQELPSKKICRVCNQEKDITCFTPQKQRDHVFYTNMCKPCRNAKLKLKRKAHGHSEQQ